MTSLILIALAAICNSVMDLVENENFHRSVFAKLNPRFWYKRESWKHARKVFGWKLDAWHIAKSAMIILLCLAIVFYQPVIPGLIYLNKPVLKFTPDWIVAGLVWNLSFNLFYNKILRS